MKPTEVFKFIRAHKGHPICPKVENLHWRIRKAKQRAYYHDKAAHETTGKQRFKHEDWAEMLRKVFIPAMQDKLNQIIETV
jgi:hypothetical protein